MFIVFFRALILYSVLFVVIRLMGKKELAKIQPFELAVIILISDLASAPMSSRGISIFDGVIPIITMLILYLIFTLITHASNKIEDVVCGTISVIIRDGKIVEEEFKKQKYTLSDIMEQLRQKNVYKIQDVKYGIIETNGVLSVVKYSDNMNGLPLNVIEDGKYSEIDLKFLDIKKEEIEKTLKENNLKVEEVLVGTFDENKNFIYQKKGSDGKWNK